MESDKLINIKSNKMDKAVILAKGILGAAPYVGPIIAEIVGATIPNQRLDRIVDFVQILDKKLGGISQDVIKLKAQDEYFIDLFEDGMLLASRAINNERKEHIATVIKNSITNDELSHLEEKKLLTLQREIV